MTKLTDDEKAQVYRWCREIIASTQYMMCCTEKEKELKEKLKEEINNFYYELILIRKDEIQDDYYQEINEEN